METPVAGDGGLVIVVPEKASAEICRWRRRYPGVRHPLSQPHITLAYPPFIREEQWPSLRPALVDCLSAFQPFDITLQEVGVFIRDLVLWLRPEDSGAIARLRAALAGRFPERITPLPDEYVAHVTVSFFDSQEALCAAQKAISSGWEAVRFQVSELVYGVLGHDDVWQRRDRLFLGGSVEPQ